jgi:1,4-alpha-glucan branching enzyme
MIKKEAAPQEGLAHVTFRLPATILAERITLVGEFNDWDTRATPLRQRRHGASWQVRLALRTGRCYRFRYLVDGQEWLNDWHADDYLENPYGSYDSVVDLRD